MRPRLSSAILGLSLFLLMPALGHADPVQLGAPTGTIEAGAINLEGGTYIELYGFLQDADPDYEISVDQPIFCGSGDSWYWCAGQPGIGVVFPSLSINTPYEEADPWDVVFNQSGPPAATLTFEDLYGYTLNFALAVDPALLSSLVPTTGGAAPVLDVNYVNLTVTAACYDTTADPSCSPGSFTSPTTTPEPSSFLLMLTGVGLLGLAMLMLKRSSRRLSPAG